VGASTLQGRWLPWAPSWDSEEDAIAEDREGGDKRTNLEAEVGVEVGPGVAGEAGALEVPAGGDRSIAESA
jgi:hypothetical protein